MASTKQRIEKLEQKIGGNDCSPYVGFIRAEYPDTETAKAAWIAEHGEPKPGQQEIWVNFVKPSDLAGVE